MDPEEVRGEKGFLLSASVSLAEGERTVTCIPGGVVGCWRELRVLT